MDPYCRVVRATFDPFGRGLLAPGLGWLHGIFFDALKRAVVDAEGMSYAALQVDLFSDSRSG